MISLFDWIKLIVLFTFSLIIVFVIAKRRKQSTIVKRENEDKFFIWISYLGVLILAIGTQIGGMF